MNIVFGIGLAGAVFAAAIFLWEICRRDKTPTKLCRIEKPLRLAARCVTILLVLAAAFDFLRALDFGAFAEAFPLLTLLCLLEWALCIWQKKCPSSGKRFAAKTVLVVMVLEMTLFNLPVYHLWFGDYPQTTLNISDAGLEGNGTRNADGTITISGDTEMVLTFENIQQQVGTIDANVKFHKDAKEALLKIDVTDETQNQEYRYDIIKHTLVNHRENSEIVASEFSGNVDKLRVKITPSNGKEVVLQSVTLNQPIAMDVSVVRVLFLLLMPVFVYAVMHAGVMNRSYAQNRKFCRIAAIGITAGFCLVAFFTVNYKLGDTSWKKEFQKTSGDQMTQELVDAFEAGQVNLLTEPSDELNALELPYDRQARESSGASVQWDHVYYNGHYYSYYGIAPVVLVFLPFHLATGYYFPATAAVLLFALIGMMGLTAVYLAFLKKWFSDTPTGIAMIGLLLLQVVSGIWFSIGRTSFYEIAISAGFACLTWGTSFLIRANVMGDGKISFWRVAVSSLLLALSVLCRPTLAVYCICAMVFLLMALPRLRKKQGLEETAPMAKHRIGYLLCAFVPMLCLAGVQIWYNMARYGSPMDFGIQYSLSINDFTKSQYHFQFVLTALYNYLWNIPIFSASYPIVSTTFQTLDSGGFFYADYLATGNTSGLCFLALPVFAYLFSGRTLKCLPNRAAKVQSLAYIGLPCVIMPVVIIASVWESGYAVRYLLDFSWQAILGAFAIIFFWYRRTDRELVKKIIKGLLCFALIWAFLVSGVQSLNQMFRYAEYHYEYPEIAYSIEQIFAFWK